LESYQIKQQLQYYCPSYLKKKKGGEKKERKATQPLHAPASIKDNPKGHFLEEVSAVGVASVVVTP